MAAAGKHIDEKDSWVKHLDFLFLDIVSYVGSFVLAYYVKFGDFSFISSYSWRSIIIFGILVELVTILLTNPFSGIFKRPATEECMISFVMVLRQFLVLCLFLYVLRRGINYSRTVVLLTYIFYGVLSFVLRDIWKDLIHRGARSLANQKKTVMVVGTSADMPQILRSVNSGFFMEYEVRGVCMTDSPVGERVSGTIDILEGGGEGLKQDPEL